MCLLARLFYQSNVGFDGCRYCSEVLSVLPFGIPDEPLYVVFTINRVVQVRAGELEANMKAIISGGTSGAAVVKQDVESTSATDEVAVDPLSTMLDTNKEVAIDMADLGGLAQDALDKLRVLVISFTTFTAESSIILNRQSSFTIFFAV